MSPCKRFTQKTFTAIPEDLESPKVSLIETNLLKPRSMDLLSITFPEPLDEQQIQEYVRIVSDKEHQPTQVAHGKFLVTVKFYGVLTRRCITHGRANNTPTVWVLLGI